MMMNALLCSLGLFVLLTQSQAFGNEVGKCWYGMEMPTTGVLDVKGYKANAVGTDSEKGKVYTIVITFTVQYQHAGDGENIAKPKTQTQTHQIAAKTEARARQDAVKIAHTFAQAELEKQCKEKKCEGAQ